MQRFCILFIGWCLAMGSAFAQDTPKKQVFSVSTDAIVRVMPDRVVLGVGAITRDRDLLGAKQKNSQIIKKAIEIARELGVTEKFISTDYLSINPDYHRDRDQPTFFNVYQGLSITLEDVSKYETLLTQLLAAGINQVQNIEFQNTALKKHRNEARLLAIKAAKEKADFLAQAAGLKLGKVVNLDEHVSSYSPFGRGRSDSMSQSQSYSPSPSGGEEEDTGDLALGMLSIRVNVTLSYDIAP